MFGCSRKEARDKAPDTGLGVGLLVLARETKRYGGGDTRCRSVKSWVGGASWRRNDSPYPATLARPNSGSGRRGRRA